MTKAGSGSNPTAAAFAVGARFALALAATLVAASLTAPGALAQDGEKAPASEETLVLSPESGERLAAGPVTIKVRPGRRARMRVRLNGRSVERYFSSKSRRGIRRLRVSPNHGLRYGRNKVRIRVHPGGRPKRSQGLRFRVPRTRPLAAAGLDVAVAPGDRVYLNGGRSRSHSGRRLDHRWKLVGMPKERQPSATLTGARRPKPTVKLGAPGTHRVRLTVRTKDGTVDSDVVAVQVDPVPAAQVDTMVESAGGKQAGIRVGETTFPAESGTKANPPWFQVVVLDRTSLAERSNKTYLCEPNPSGFCGNGELERDLGKLTEGELVIAANHRDARAVQWATPSVFPFERIGVPDFGSLPDQPWQFSAIGVPGTKEGGSDWRLDAGVGAGRMQGYLIRSNEGYFAFAAKDRIAYDTQAPGSNESTNVITVGEKRFAQALRGDAGEAGDGRGGFHVVVADAITLEGESHWFTTGSARSQDPNAALISRLSQMHDVLKRANDADDKLIFVASRGSPSVPITRGRADTWELLVKQGELAAELERAGGTRIDAFRALYGGLSRQTSYTLVGHSGASGGHGIEAVEDDTSAGRTALNKAPLTGRMARTGPNYGFAPQSTGLRGDRAGGSEADPSAAVARLTEVLVGDPTPWPEQGHAGRTAAIKWIGKKVFGNDNPRGQYWTKRYKADTWDTFALRTQGLTYPQAQSPSFTAEDLEWAKTELAGPRKDPAVVGGEIGWLKNVNDYLDDLASPFSEDALASWAAFESISSRIRDEIGVGPDREVEAETGEAIGVFLGIVGLVPEGGEEVVDAIEAIYKTALLLSTDNGVDVEEPFSAKAGELGEALADRLRASQQTLTRRIPDAIAADYGKLKAIGSCTSSDPADWNSCPFDHQDWELTQDDQAVAAKALLPQMKTWAYGSLLSARYELYQLPWWWRSTVGDNQDFFGSTAFANFFPFEGVPKSASVAKPIYDPTGPYAVRCTRGHECTHDGASWQIYALGYLTGEGTIVKPWLMHYPKAEVTDPIFNPVGEGGLAADQAAFFDRYFPKASRFNRRDGRGYPLKDSPTGWCQGSAASPPPECHEHSGTARAP